MYRKGIVRIGRERRPPLYIIMAVGLLGLSFSIECNRSSPQFLREKGNKPTVSFEIRKAETEPLYVNTSFLEGRTVKSDGNIIFIYPTVELSNDHVLGTSIVKDEKERSIIEVLFTKEGSKILKRITESRIKKPIAFIVEGQVVAAPLVMGTLDSGRVTFFTKALGGEKEATRIAKGIVGFEAKRNRKAPD